MVTRCVRRYRFPYLISAKEYSKRNKKNKELNMCLCRGTSARTEHQKIRSHEATNQTQTEAGSQLEGSQNMWINE